VLLCEAIARSARECAWVDLPADSIEIGPEPHRHSRGDQT
jgi:hypothetical protein